MRVAINGAGVAGPTLAWWLRKTGHDVLLVEQAPTLRSGGYAIDFWGLGYDIAEKMGLLPRLHELGFKMKEVRYVNRQGRKCGGFSVDVFDRLTGGRFIEVRRSDLAATVYGTLDEHVETLFGDSIAGIDEQADGVQIAFDHAAPREVDLVIGADGLHSRVRQLVFGEQSEFEVSLGYHVAAFEIERYRPREELVAVSHATPGRQVFRMSLPGDTTLFLFVFRDEYMNAEPPSNEQECKAALRHVYGDVEWECPHILTAMEDVRGVYFDRVSQIRMDRWTSGRIALVGDAAACVSLVAGEGTGLAMAEAYVLAGELGQCGNDYAAAFTRYEERMMSFLKQKQESAATFASSFAPRTSLGITFRNYVTRLLKVRPIADYFVGRAVRDDLTLPDYD